MLSRLLRAGAMIRNLLLARRLVIALLALLLAAVLLAYLVPQQWETEAGELARWQRQYPLAAPLVGRLGLDRVYSSIWFAALLAVFLCSLALTTVAQFRLARQKAFGAGQAAGRGRRLNLAMAACGPVLAGHGFRLVHQGPGRQRFLKGRLGFWGDAIFHGGLLITIASALVFALTLERGRLSLVEGQVYQPAVGNIQLSRGLLAAAGKLPAGLRLDEILPEYWENDQIRHFTTRLTMIDEQGQRSRHTVAINRSVFHDGIRYYQGTRFGQAFFLLFRDPQGREFREVLMLDSPPSRGEAGYGDLTFAWLFRQAKAKYYADLHGRGMAGGAPLLVLRWRTGEAWEEVSLIPGGRERIGEYGVELLNASPWTDIVYVVSRGMPGVFAGFVLIMLGSGLAYFAVPREIVLRQTEGGLFCHWRAFRFASLYDQEREELMAALREAQKS